MLNKYRKGQTVSYHYFEHGRKEVRTGVIKDFFVAEHIFVYTVDTNGEQFYIRENQILD